MYISSSLFTETPDCTARTPSETAVYDLLNRLQIPFVGCDHDHADTIEMCHCIEKVLDVAICKNLFLCNTQHTNFHLLLMPGDKKFKTKDFSKQIGSSRLSFADAQHMEEFLGLTPGSVSVLGLMNDKEHRVKLSIDRDLLQDAYIGCHPCMNTSTLKIKLSDILNVFLPHFGIVPTVVELPVYEE